MSERKLARIELVDEIKPIEGADAIELAIIGGWQCVVAKADNIKPGDKVVYMEIDSIVNKENPVFAFMENKNWRVRTIKLRGQISQGLAMPLRLFGLPEGLEVGDEVTEVLGITKYEPYIPPEMTGITKGNFPSFLQKTDEERVQNLKRVIEQNIGTECYISEKIDGTSSSFYFNNSVFGVCSRNLELCESDTNSLWMLARKNDLENKLRNMYAVANRHFCVQGEIAGPGIQENKYKLSELKLLMFSVFDIDRYAYLNYQDFREFCDLLSLETVPIINDKFVLNHTVQELIDMAEGQSILNPNVQREGIVIRSLENKDVIGLGRFSFKAINNKFLLKHGE